jgi:transmembrane 9 superfamily protein 2/4
MKAYKDGEDMPLYVNKVYSDNTQTQFAYYDLPFVCPPTGAKHGGIKSGQGKSLNLGEVLRGDRIMSSDYDLAMGEDQECKYLCSQEIDRATVKRAQELVEDGYVAEWIVDNLPGATSFVTVDKTRKYYAAGFKLGYKDFSSIDGNPKYLINNHLTLVLRWRRAPGRAGDQGEKVVIGFEVYSKSIGMGGRSDGGCPRDVHNVNEEMELYIPLNNTGLASKYPDSSYLPESDDGDDGAKLSIPFSYSVYFREDDRVEWANRWDMYFKNQEESTQIHWLAILNALVIAGLLTAVVIMVFNRALYGDPKTRDAPIEDGKSRPKRKAGRMGSRSPKLGEKGNGLLDQAGGGEADDDFSSDDELIEDITGWKLLHADVFRTPAYAGLLAPVVGSGMQLVFMAACLLLLSAFGVLNPSFRGGFVSVGMGLFVFAGLLSGYFSGRVYKTFNGLSWRKNTLMVSLSCGGSVLALTCRRRPCSSPASCS